MTPLRRLRKARGITLEQVAQGVGLDVGNLSRLERRQQGVRPALAEKIVAFFGNGITELEILYPERFTAPDFEAREAA